jgi:hypothetical protein
MLGEARIAGRCGFGFLPRGRGRKVQLDGSRNRFGDERIAVEDPQAFVVSLDPERTLEGGRRAQRDLGAPAEQRGDPAARVSPVRRSVRPIEAGLYRQVFHRR